MKGIALSIVIGYLIYNAAFSQSTPTVSDDDILFLNGYLSEYRDEAADKSKNRSIYIRVDFYSDNP